MRMIAVGNMHNSVNGVRFALFVPQGSTYGCAGLLCVFCCVRILRPCHAMAPY